MKEMNGTVTLAFVEEDNRQRVIFRVIPLCTREGGVFHGGAEDFPDEGSLRIVPDKREQSTFKERMREIGGLCVIQLTSDGRELLKVRQNRNYAPDQGEKNQLAIYSDVVCEFVEDGCFEVFEAGADASAALTAKVLIRNGKMLYGPVAREEAAAAKADALKPFGNERFLLHGIDAPQVGGKHQICWDPEATINWRQRRNSLRKRERGQQEEDASAETKAPEQAAEKPQKAEAPKAEPVKPEPKPEAARPEKTEKPEKPEKNKKEEKRKSRAERAAEAQKQEASAPAEEPKKPEKPAPVKAEADAALPIGEKLEILDSAVPFEQQISRLAQPLSESANRLTGDVPTAEEEEPETVTPAHFTGTALNRSTGKPIRSKTRPDNMHQVVEQQIAGQRDETMGSELGSGTYGMVENPIESLRSCVEYVWQNADMRDQALSMLLQNEAFAADMTAALRKGGVNMQASAAAQEQLAEIEADRIGLLLQLEQAKANTKAYREETIAKAAQKKRDEIERLRSEAKQMEAKGAALREANRVLSLECSEKTAAYFARELTVMTGVSDNRVVLSPVLGTDYESSVLAENLRMHMNANGFSISDDEAMCLLVTFSLSDTLCLSSRTVQDARQFARVAMEAFGLQSVSTDLVAGASVEIVSLLDENALRAPTVSVQAFGTEALGVFGHKTIYVTDQAVLPPQAQMPSMPIVMVPAMHKRTYGTAEEWKPLAPASIASFEEHRNSEHKLLTEAEKWLADLKRALEQENVPVPSADLVCVRRFIEAASRKVRGGFLTAADIAVCLWVVPTLRWMNADCPAVTAVLNGLPHAMEQLNLH